jgi:hypothetical protein
MREDTEPELNRADAAIQSIENDLLERDTFAIDIANSIRNWSSSESLVIGISGRWGEGKTSVLNMIKEALQEDIESLDDVNDDKESPLRDSRRNKAEGVQILEFQPWQFTGIEVIARSFFQDLGQKIGEADESDETEELGIKVQQLGNLLSQVGGVRPDGTLSWRAKVAFTILGALLLSTNGLPGILSSVFGFETAPIPSWLSTLILIIVGLISFTAVLAPWVNYTANFLTEQSRIDEKTTSELRADIVDDLRERDCPLVVLIDDVDRLTIDEVKLLFQLVRSSASFPNVVYVMGLEVARMRERLDDEGINKDYLEKIIQEVYDLPDIPEGRIDDYAETRILSDEIFGADAIERRLSISQNARWNISFGLASNYYFNTLRDVNRFLSSFQMQVGRFTRHNVFEANPVDLFASHVLREFERPVFQNLLESEYLLCQAPGPPLPEIEDFMEYEEERGGREEPVSSREEKLDEMVRQAENDTAVRRILAVLFPYAAKYLLEDGARFDPDHTDWILERRIAHPFYFRSYFEQRPANRPLSKEEEKDLRDLLHDSDKLQDELEEWSQSDRLLEGLHFLRAFVQEGNLKEHEHKAIVKAFRSHEGLLNDDRSRVGSDGLDLSDEPTVPFEVADDTVNEIVGQADSESETRDLIESLLDSPPALRFARSALLFVENENRPNVNNLSDSTLKSLQKKYAHEVAEKAENASPKVRNTIYDRDDFAEIIVFWFKWGDAEKATNWLEDQIEKGNLCSIATKFEAEENGSENGSTDQVEFKRELLEVLDGTLSVRDLREEALKEASEASTEGIYKWTNRPEVFNSIEDFLRD